MNVAIYVRVSTQEQKLHGISVDAQESTCREWVHDNGHRLVGVYNDAGLSARAKYTKRSAMLHLIDDIRAGKVELIIFTKLDRWFRNVADYYEVQSILEQHHVKWRAIQEDYETETASGRFKVNIMLAVAQDEADRTSERIKAATDYKRKKGEVTGRVPVGYVIKDKHYAFDPEKKAGMDAFFATYLETLSTTKAITVAHTYGIHLNVTHCNRILRNPTYHGDAFGVPCPAYISPEQFQIIRQNTSNYSRNRKTGRIYLFSGLLRCGVCGGSLTSAAMPQRKSNGIIKYYRCTNHVQYTDRCPGTYANEKKLESFLVSNLSPFLEEFRSKTISDLSNRIDYSSEIKRLEGKLSRLKDLYIDGEIDRSDFDSRSAPIKSELQRLQDESITPFDTRLESLDLPSDWQSLYSDLSDDAKQTFWKKTVKRIIIFKNRPPQVEF